MIMIIGTLFCSLLEGSISNLDFIWLPILLADLHICMLFFCLPQHLHVVCWPPLHACLFLSLLTSSLIAHFTLLRVLVVNLSSSCQFFPAPNGRARGERGTTATALPKPMAALCCQWYWDRRQVKASVPCSASPMSAKYLRVRRWAR